MQNISLKNIYFHTNMILYYDIASIIVISKVQTVVNMYLLQIHISTWYIGSNYNEI